MDCTLYSIAPYFFGLKFLGQFVFSSNTASLRFTLINFDVLKFAPLKFACERFVFLISILKNQHYLICICKN